MARKKDEDLESIEETNDYEEDNDLVEASEEAQSVEELEDQLEEETEDKTEDSMELSQDIQEQYGSPEQEQRDNQWSITRKAIDNKDTLRVTYLSEQELGKPFFSVRFLLDLQDLALHYNCDRVATYFQNKISNITDSGMSNKGFIMNLTATQKRDQVKRRIREVGAVGDKNKESS